MLSEEEKREMLEDAKSEKRRVDFLCAKEKARSRKESLDDYISFLDYVQKLFRPFSISQKPTITNSNKL